MVNVVLLNTSFSKGAVHFLDVTPSFIFTCEHDQAISASGSLQAVGTLCLERWLLSQPSAAPPYNMSCVLWIVYLLIVCPPDPKIPNAETCSSSFQGVPAD